MLKKECTDTHTIYNILGLKIKIAKKVSKNDIVELKNLISNEVFVSNLVSNIHSKTFPQYKNIHEGKEVVVVACGPTMKDYVPMENVIHIGVNKAYQNSNIKFDYLFAHDYRAVKDHLENIINYPAEKFLGSNLTRRKGYLKDCIIPMKYQNKDSVNLYFTDYPRNLSYPYIEHCALMDFRSIIFAATQFALYTNPARIYLVGCDCSDCGYFDGSKQFGKASHLTIGWQKLKEYRDTYYPDTEIVSINPVGLKGMFKDVYTKL